MNWATEFVLLKTQSFKRTEGSFALLNVEGRSYIGQHCFKISWNGNLWGRNAEKNSAISNVISLSSFFTDEAKCLVSTPDTGWISLAHMPSNLTRAMLS